ncbi:MAG: RsmE family RNA methyltransferase [Isosphaeraceae bacterium]
MADRFFCPDPPREGRYHLPPEEARHLTRVCRRASGDRVEIFDGRGFATTALIVEAKGNSAVLQPEGEPLPAGEPAFRLTLATAVPKGDRFDWIVEKATELGVERLIPVVAERSVVVPRDSKLDRLRRSIVEASKQCRRSRLMDLDPPMEWARLVKSFAERPRFLADPAGLAPSAWPSLPRGGEIVLAVGPEGGLTPDELEQCAAADWVPIVLGCHTLRVETAALAGCAALLCRSPER